MGFLDFLRGPDIHQGLAAFQAEPDAVLLDVRTEAEYRTGHIPGSVNLPLQDIWDVEAMVPDKSTPVFIHCQSGARSRQAAARLSQLGYKRVTNIGGIAAYRGKVER